VKLAHRVLLYSFVLIVVLVVAILAIVDNRLHTSIAADNENSLEREARFVGVQWLRGGDPDSLANAAGRALGRRVTLIDSTGVVVGDSEFDGPALHRLQNHLFRPEVVQASREGTGTSRRRSPSKGDEEVYAAVRAGSGFARVSLSTGAVDELFDQARRDIVLSGVLALIGATLLAALFARQVSRPIIELRDMAHGLAERDFHAVRVVNAPGEVGDLAASLNQLSTRLEALESMRRDFVANVSHELRTPLTVVGGFAETLTDDQLADERRKEFAGMILASTHRMQRIVDDLLDLSRIESGGWVPHPEWVSVTEAVDEVMTSLAPAAEKKGLTIRTYIPAAASTVWADRTAVRQILSNLIENAIRHTPSGVVTIFSEADPSGKWIGVRDTGEGISNEHLPRIFERFYRADSGRSRDEGGTGLGLSIVRHMAEAHGGRVRASSRVGEGTAISAFFPEPSPATQSL
jgi:signal transduction histidine kinase